jgi:putative cardiolipin synthase
MDERSTERGAAFEPDRGSARAQPAAGQRSAAAAVLRGAARALLSLAAAPALLWLGACASLPAEVQRTPSTAIADVAATALARVVAQSTPPELEQLSGVRLLGDAAQAFALRLALVRAARSSLDLQYYLIAPDDSGAQLLGELEQAARRGVRVRLLVDDLHAAAAEPALQRLSALPWAEVRLFNPLPSRAGSAWPARMLLSLHEFGRVNRRMHNKLFIADHSLAVTGGRNIGDEYFMRGSSANFIDLELLASGAIVPQLSQLFDRFWNSAQAFPIESLTPAAAVAAAAATRTTAGAAPPQPAPGDALLHELEQGRIELHFAPLRLLADAPDKAADPGSAAAAPTAMDGVLQFFAAARYEIDVVSPYFVPGRSTMAQIRAAAASGVRLALTTNSLASTDEPLAYLGYARYRDELLGLGAAIAELSPAGPPAQVRHAGLSASVGRLHAKVATIDRRWLLIGSLNMDARSAHTNTELVLAIDSPALAAEASTLLHTHWRDDHVRLRRVPSGVAPGVAPQPADASAPWPLQGVGGDTDAPPLHSAESELNALARIWLGLLWLFVPEDWL